MKSTRLLIVVISIIIISTECGVIIPDSQNPILFKYPTNSLSGMTLTINFSFPSNSPGLTYREFLGITFSPDIKSNLLFDQTVSGSPKFSCSLTDGVNNYLTSAYAPIGSSFNPSILAESNIAFCRLEDVRNLKLNVNYQLSINLTGAISSIQFVKTIGLFSSTSNDPDRIIIDSIPVIGSLGQYGNYMTYFPKLLDVTNVNVINTTTGVRSPNLIYPYNSFDVSFNMEANNFIDSNNYIIAFTFPTNTVLGPVSVSSSPINSNSPLKQALAGNLTLLTSQNMIILQGWTETLVRDRIFNLRLKGWTALDTNLTVVNNLEFWVFYKNTYSPVSYQNYPIFSVLKILINGSVNHPEYFDLYSNGAWPLKFSFNVQTDLTKGGFLLIQQINTSDTLSKFSFIASSCDFSDNVSSFDNSFGKRPSCFPYRNDFLYPGFPSTASFPGSGIFFKLSSLYAAVGNYYVTVWGFADVCGSTYDATQSNNTTAYSQFQFLFTVFQNINPNAMGELRLNYSSNSILAQSYTTTMGNKCWQANSIGQGAGSDNLFINQKTTPTVDITVLKEFTDFLTMKVTSTTLSNYLGTIFEHPVNYPMINKTTFALNISEAFLYSSSGNSVGTNSYVFLGTHIVGNTNSINTIKLKTLFAFPYVNNVTNANGAPNDHKSGRLYAQFSRNFFVSGDTYNPSSSATKCYLTWSILSSTKVSTASLTVGSINCPEKPCTLNISAPPTYSNFIACCNILNPLGVVTFYSYDYGNIINDYLQRNGQRSRCGLTGYTPLFTDSTSTTCTTAGVPVSVNLISSPSSQVTYDTDCSSINYWNNQQLVYTPGFYAFNKLEAMYPDSNDRITMDVMTTTLPPNVTSNTGKETIYKIISNYEPAATPLTNNSPSLLGRGLYTRMKSTDSTLDGVVAEDRNFGQFMMLTTCLKWAATLPQIKSLFTYLDVQFSWITTSTSTLLTPITKVNRFIKLFPEGGLFHDWSKAYKVSTGAAQSFGIIHYAIGTATSATNNQGVCILEVDGGVVYNSWSSQSNTMLIWLFGVSLIDIDYNDVTATYPIAPLYNSSLIAYGLSSANPMSAVNQHLRSWDTTSYGGHFSTLNAAPSAVGRTSSLPVTGDAATVMPATATLLESLMAIDKLKPSLNPAINIIKSRYHHFMASIVVITGISSNFSSTLTSPYSNILIPFYCPTTSGYISSTSNTNHLVINNPWVQMQWLSMSSWNNISNVNTLIANWDTVNYSFVVYGYKGFTSTITTTASSPLVQSTLKFNPYSMTSLNTDAYLYVYNGNSSTSGQTVSCHAFSLFVNSYSVDTTVTLVGATSSTIYTYVNILGKNFYINGKIFTKFIGSSMYGIGIASSGTSGSIPSAVNQISASIVSSSTSSMYYYGVRRPTIDKFSVNGNIVSTDNIAFHCTSSYSNNWMTNYTYATAVSSNSIQNYLLDFNPDSTVSWIGITFGNDNSEGVFKSDPAGNLQISFTLPYNIPVGSQLLLSPTSTSMTVNSICGIVPNTGSIVKDCTILNGVINCPVSSFTNNFYVCCYNIGMTDTIILTSAIANLPNNPAISSLSSYIISNLISVPLSGTNPFTWVTNQSTATDVISNINSKITIVTYSQIQQDQGIGKITFSISLARSIVRDMKLTLIGDISGLLIPNLLPLCKASINPPFGSSLDSGDFLINNCSVTNLSSTSNPIIVTTKRIIYKCKIGLSKNLIISIWPIVAINFNVAPYITNLYRVILNLNTGGDVIANNSQSFNMPFSTNLLSKPIGGTVWLTLCPFTITPNIPEEIGDITFTINFALYQNILINTSPDEISLFFPDKYFPETMNVICYYQQIMVNCIWSDSYILNIMFNNPISTINSGILTIVGITVPYLDVSIAIPCSINVTNFFLGIRTNLIVGSGSNSGGINIAPNYTNLGGLIVINPVSVNNNNPRNISTYSFKIGYDYSIGLTPTTFTVLNPVFIITLPTDFNLAYFINTSASVSITEYSKDSFNNIVPTQSLTTQSIVQSGNRIIVTIGTNLSVTIRFMYYNIMISNVVAPNNNSIANQTTGRFRFTIASSDFTSVYRTYTNFNNIANIPLSANYDVFIQFNRGVQFNFDNFKWIIDIVNSTLLNSIVIRPGRYFLFSFVVRQNLANNILPSFTYISLSDPIFKMQSAQYLVTSSHNSPFTFYIGVGCGTLQGNYFLLPLSSNNVSFAPMPLVFASILIDNIGQISYNSPINIPTGGSLFLIYNFSEPNVDPFTITWLSNTNNDPTATITNVLANSFSSSISAIFSIVNSNNNQPQTFTTSDPNNCYTWPRNNITFTIQGATAIIPPNVNISSFFVLYDSNADSSIPKSSIYFQVTSQYYPVYIYCALICSNNTFPIDSFILGQNFSFSYYSKGYNALIPSNSPYNIYFNNLMRGILYKLRCILTTTQYNYNQRTSSAVSLTLINSSYGNLTTIQAAPQQTTQCLQFSFNSNPGYFAKSAIIYYCQKQFSQPGFFASGCIICTDQNGITSPGLNLTNETCSGPYNQNNILPLTIGNTTLVNTTDVYSVCAIPYPVCNTDVSGSISYSNFISNLVSNLQTPQLIGNNLGIYDVPNFTLAVIQMQTSTLSSNNSFVISNQFGYYNGTISFSIVSNNSLVCYIEINNSTNLPAQSEILLCNDTARCYTIVSTPPSSSFTNSNIRQFLPGQYTVYGFCKNTDLTNPFSSNVSLFFNFTIYNSNSSGVIPINSTYTNQSTTSSKQMLINVFVILLIMFLT